MKIPFVDLKVQYESIKSEIDQAIGNVISETAFIGGKYVKNFEEEFAAYCRAKYCIGVGNGTDAIYIALRGLGVGQGDEVITVANSFIATSEAITMTGAKVVFVDCDSQTFNLDEKKITAAITKKTKAIVPVHLYGRPADMMAINRIARENNLFVVEDAAQAHGAEIGDQKIGTFGNLACFSFYPGKNLGAYGDGGAIVTNDQDLAVKCRMIANHGRIKKYDHDFEGVNSRLDGLQAAILSVKLRHLDDWTNKRRGVAATYRSFLQNSDIIYPMETDNAKHVYHLFVVRVQNRDKVQASLASEGIATGIHYPIALPNLEAYRYLGYKQSDFPAATSLSGEIMSLPMFPELDANKVEYICDKLKMIVK